VSNIYLKFFNQKIDNMNTCLKRQEYITNIYLSGCGLNLDQKLGKAFNRKKSPTEFTFNSFSNRRKRYTK